VVLDGVAYLVTETGTPMADATSLPVLAASEPSATPSGPATTATEPAPVAIDAPEVTAPAAPAGPTPFCAAPAFGVGLLLLPGLWAWRRRLPR
jgi:hypothetical protein